MIDVEKKISSTVNCRFKADKTGTEVIFDIESNDVGSFGYSESIFNDEITALAIWLLACVEVSKRR